MNYNPYDLVPLLINNKLMHGRPFEFNSTIVNQKKMTNALGELVKPTRVTTVCPDCGQGMHLDVVLGDPPFMPFAVSCANCNPTPPPMSDSFMNPVKSGRVTMADLDPLMYKHGNAIIPAHGSAADNFPVPDAVSLQSLTPEPGLPGKPARPQRDKRKKKDAPKAVEPVPPVAPPTPPTTLPVLPSPGFEVSPYHGVQKAQNTQMAEESDFDDQDMVE